MEGPASYRLWLCSCPEQPTTMRYGRPVLPYCLAVKSQEFVHPGALCGAGCRQTTKPTEEAPRMDIHKNAR